MRYWTKYKLEKKKIPKKLVFKVATFVVPGIDFANLKKKTDLAEKNHGS